MSVFITADFELLFSRVSRRNNRPLLKTANPRETLQNLIDVRYPIYAEADVTVESRDVPQDVVATETIDVLIAHLQPRGGRQWLSACVHVPLGERAYDIVIGERLLGDGGSAARGDVPRAALRHRHRRNGGKRPAAAARRRRSMRRGCSMPRSWCRRASGPSRSQSSRPWSSGILDARLERGDIIIALGGGVIGDLAGFAAAIARRGMDFVQIPTSLLAQVDSSVGGKTGINAPQGKNLVGAFHQPKLVLADLGALETLPPREFAAGYAEVVKYGLIDDEAFFFWLEEHRPAIFAGDAALRGEMVARCCAAKTRFVLADEKETGVRALLNLGHTFGHALEKATGYSDRLLHGEGVAIGMVLAHGFSAKLGLAPSQDTGRIAAQLEVGGTADGAGGYPWRTAADGSC